MSAYFLSPQFTSEPFKKKQGFLQLYEVFKDNLKRKDASIPKKEWMSHHLTLEIFKEQQETLGILKFSKWSDKREKICMH